MFFLEKADSKILIDYLTVEINTYLTNILNREYATHFESHILCSKKLCIVINSTSYLLSLLISNMGSKEERYSTRYLPSIPKTGIL